ncbi:MAG: NAD(P)H-binding protein [Candidatus Promineifilaceae bacterium]|nr:NAD(P)H-binding protein [Candidatus Promineifilaceae bacterium]
MSGSSLVTGATGNVGWELVQILHRENHPVRAAALGAADAEQLPHPNVPWVRFDFGDLDTYATTFASVDRLFLMRPPAISDVDRYMRPVVDCAGVRHIVFLSLLGADKNSLVPHAQVQRLLRESGTPFTFLRAGFFMQNLSTTHAAEIQLPQQR